MKPPLIPNIKRGPKPPEPGSTEEFLAIEEFATNAMGEALMTFGPDNTGAAIAALCCALGTLYRMITLVPDFYKTPDRYADAVRTMVLDVAAAPDRD